MLIGKVTRAAALRSALMAPPATAQAELIVSALTSAYVYSPSLMSALLSVNRRPRTWRCA